LKDDLRFVLITSYAAVEPLADAPASAAATDVVGIKLVVEKSAYTKCVRCWHHREDVGTHAEHPEICNRCVENIDGTGEVREFA